MQAEGYEFYRTYLALKLHFETDYDIVKYGGRIKRSLKSPKILNGLIHFTKKYSKNELIEYLVANFTKGDRCGGIFNCEGDDNYLDWKRRTQNLTYNFKKDINTIENRLQGKDFERLFESDGQHPLIMKLYLGKHITLETVVILNTIYDFSSKLNEQLKEDFLWNDFKRLVCKYQPFLCIDKDKYENIIKTKFCI